MESGPFTKSNNRCHITFDANGVTNMRDSYLDVRCRFKDGSSTVVTHNKVFLGDGTTRCQYSPSALIKHITLSTESTGIMEENRFINRYNQTIQQYTMTQEEMQSLQIFGYGEAEIESDDETHLMIPLREILGCGIATNYPNQRLGRSTLKIEFEDVLQVAHNIPKPYFNFADVSLAEKDNSGGADALSVSQVTTTATFDSWETFQAIFEKGTTVTVDNSYNTLDHDTEVTALHFDDTNNTGTITLKTPFTVGAGVNENTLTITVAATPYATFNDINNTQSVSSITYANTDKVFSTQFATHIAFKAGTEYHMVHQAPKTVVKDTTNNTTTLTFNRPIFTASADTNITNIQIETAPVALDYEVTDVELVLNKPNKFSVPKSFPYSTWQVESVNQPSTTDYRKQFEIQPNCSKVYLMFPTSTLVSDMEGMKSYRASINGFDTTNRDIVVAPNGALYQDKLISCVPGLRALDPTNGITNVLTIPENMPGTGQENVVQVRAAYNPACAAKVMYVFKVLNQSV